MRVRLRSSVPGTVSEGWRSRVRHGVGVPGMVIWGWMMRVRLGVGVPAPLCGYACLVAYLPLMAVFTLRVCHGEGLPAVYGESYGAGTPLDRRIRYSLRSSHSGYALVWAYPLYGAGTPALWRPRSTVQVRLPCGVPGRSSCSESAGTHTPRCTRTICSTKPDAFSISVDT